MEGNVNLKRINIKEIPIDKIRPNPFQTRQHYSNLNELATSIEDKGLINPIMVRRNREFYQIITGHRRFFAFKQLRRRTIPAIIDNVSDEKMLEKMLTENLQRSDLNPIEEAKGYALLRDNFRWIQEKIAQKMGKKRVYIAQRLRLLTFRIDIQELVSRETISVSIAETITMAPAAKQDQILNRIRYGWRPTVRELREYINNVYANHATDIHDFGRGEPSEKRMEVTFSKKYKGYLDPTIIQGYKWFQNKGYNGTLSDFLDEVVKFYLTEKGLAIGIIKFDFDNSEIADIDLM